MCYQGNYKQYKQCVTKETTKNVNNALPRQLYKQYKQCVTKATTNNVNNALPRQLQTTLRMRYQGNELHGHLIIRVTSECSTHYIIAGSLESANSSILAACDHFKEVVGKKIRVL